MWRAKTVRSAILSGVIVLGVSSISAAEPTDAVTDKDVGSEAAMSRFIPRESQFYCRINLDDLRKTSVFGQLRHCPSPAADFQLQMQALLGTWQENVLALVFVGSDQADPEVWLCVAELDQPVTERQMNSLAKKAAAEAGRKGWKRRPVDVHGHRVYLSKDETPMARCLYAPQTIVAGPRVPLCGALSGDTDDLAPPLAEAVRSAHPDSIFLLAIVDPKQGSILHWGDSEFVVVQVRVDNLVQVEVACQYENAAEAEEVGQAMQWLISLFLEAKEVNPSEADALFHLASNAEVAIEGRLMRITATLSTEQAREIWESLAEQRSSTSHNTEGG